MKSLFVNLSSNSKFQDIYFVSGAQLTPFRQLRQIELELNSIEGALKHASISQRRTQLKIDKLNPDIPEEALDIEEAQWGLRQQAQLQQEAKSRLANFKQLKEDLLRNTPEEYWAQGYEAAEAENWVLHYSKQLALENITSGRPSKQTLEQIILLPLELQQQIVLKGNQEFIRLGGVNTTPDIEAIK